MNFEEVRQWENTFNTVTEKEDRGASYEKFKNEKTNIFIDELEKKLP